jgi:hypothetical protein
MRSRRAASFAVMSLIDGMIWAQLFKIPSLFKVTDVLVGGAMPE